jgi:hypothetical protein
LPLESWCLARVYNLVITCALNGIICSCNRITDFGIKLKVSSVLYHGCYGNLVDLWYWLQADVRDNFYCHLELIKSHYYNERCLQPIKLLNSSTLLEVAKIFPWILSRSGLEMQANIFKINMKSNATTLMEAPFHVNPLTWLWRMLEASRISRHSFPGFFKLVEIIIMQMLGLVEDEQTFSTLSFIKSKLRYCLNEHL